MTHRSSSSRTTSETPAFDHQCLNDLLANPTVELQLVWIWEQLQPTLGGLLYELTLRETARNSATYRGEQ
jgi:6-pyruvoyltetrahydropterin/6-carboxytetrahydropterin synthase